MRLPRDHPAHKKVKNPMIEFEQMGDVVNRTIHQGISQRLLFSNHARFYRPIATEMNTGDRAEAYSQPLRVGGAWCFFFRLGLLVWVLLAMEHGGYKKPIH